MDELFTAELSGAPPTSGGRDFRSVFDSLDASVRTSRNPMGSTQHTKLRAKVKRLKRRVAALEVRDSQQEARIDKLEMTFQFLLAQMQQPQVAKTSWWQSALVKTAPSLVTLLAGLYNQHRPEVRVLTAKEQRKLFLNENQK